MSKDKKNNLYLIAEPHIVKRYCLVLKEREDELDSIEKVIEFLENNDQTNVTEVCRSLTGEDAYAFAKTEKDLCVIIKETPEVTE